jgi:uncharacterized protein YecE (DUF72 family)
VDVWIGTSGYSYADWVGPFYPPGTRPAQMLGHYARHFPLVELNFTFYRSPTPEVLAKVADKAPPGFQFLVKLPRSLSHEERPDDLPGFRHSVEGLRRRGCLLGLLCQLPQANHHGRRRLAWLEWLGKELTDYRLAVEFRHRSWARPDVAPWLAERRLDLVAVDAPDLAALYPSGLVQSGPRVYVRFHSRNAGNWYLSDKERYDYDYDEPALAEWVEALMRAADRTEQALLLFNNCHRSQAVDGARRLASLFRQAAAPGMRLVPPVAPGSAAGPTQRSLFEAGGEGGP